MNSESMSNPSQTAFEKMRPQEKLGYIRSIQTPTAAEISLLISTLTDSKENEMIQAAVLPILKNADGKTAAEFAEKLTVCFNQTPIQEEKTRIKLSYALTQISKTPPEVFEDFTKNAVPQIRQNGVIGLSFQNSGKYDALFLEILLNDLNPKTAFEAAATLETEKDRTLPILKDILRNNLSKKIGEKTDSDFQLKCIRLEEHVLGKVIEIVGKAETKEDEEERRTYVESYTAHENSKISNLAKEIINTSD